MSSQTRSIGDLLGSRGERAERPMNPALAWIQKYSPSQGWATFVILLLTLLVVSNSINVADWVDFEGLTAIMVWSAVVGLALSKIRARWFALIPAGLLTGAFAILWQAAGQMGGESAADGLRVVFERLGVWWEAATTGGISTDLLPFFLAMLTIGWCVGFFSSWFIFRSDNVWVAVVLMGTAILTNLSFLPESFAFRFFMFVFLAMILVVRVSFVQRHERWKALGVSFTSATSWLALHATIWFSIVVVIVALALPLRVYTNETAARVWTVGRTPVASAEDFFARMFAALPSKMDQPGRFFSKWLPFTGKISFGGEPVGWASSRYPSYWTSQTYNYYTSKGWIATETEHLDIGPDTLPPPRRDGLERVAESQIMQLGFETNSFLTGGDFEWVSREGTVESLAPRKFAIYMNDSSVDAEYPQDIQELAAQVRTNAAGLTAVHAQATISDILPSDLLIVDVEADSSDATQRVTLQRKAPTAPELVAWSFSERSTAHEPYRMTSYVSVATDDDLRGASTEYEAFTTDHYLQLPSSLPQRVGELAESVTAGADNPLDKALAIQGYLRGSEFTYSQDIEAPPPDSDGVDWFLFDAKSGYSDYFGSSMTVMLRSVGVPARMAAGYAPGELNEEGQRVIRDSDSHGWVQAYFPEYGWIDFEPTPNWPTHERQPLAGRAAGIMEDPLEEDPDDALGALGFNTSIEDLLEEGGGSGGGGALAEVVSDYSRYLVGAGIALAGAAAIWLAWSAIWNFGLGALAPESRLYAKMTRLGWLAGLGRKPEQTPIEYGAYVGRSVPAADEGARKIASTYATARYGGREADEDEREELALAWKGMRLSLASRMFRRLIPQTQERRG